MEKVYVLHVPSPVVLSHVSESSVDSSLSGDGVRSGREELGDTSGVESSLGESESSCRSGRLKVWSRSARARSTMLWKDT